METAEEYALTRWPDDPHVSHDHREGNRVARQYFLLGADWRAAPPTDDERVAEFDAFRDANPNWYKGSPFTIAWTFWKAGLRRQGPPTDEWEYGVEVTGSTGEPVVPGMTWIAPVASAETFFPSFIRHMRRRKAGPWEPVEAARDAS